MAKAQFAQPERDLDSPYITLTLSEREVRILGALFAPVLSRCKGAMGIVDAIGDLLEDDDWQFKYDTKYGDMGKVKFYTDYGNLEQTEVEDVSIRVEGI